MYVDRIKHHIKRIERRTPDNRGMSSLPTFSDYCSLRRFDDLDWE